MTITPLIICCFFLLLDFIVLNKKSLYPLELIDWFNLQCIGSSICFVWLVDGPSLSPHSRRRWREETQVALWRLSVHTGGDCRQDGWQQTHGNIIFDETICVRHRLTSFTLSLQVHAKHEEKTETKSVYREYNREFLLPKGTDPEMIRSSLSKVSYHLLFFFLITRIFNSQLIILYYRMEF